MQGDCLLWGATQAPLKLWGAGRMFLGRRQGGWKLTSILGMSSSCCLMRRKTESKASSWACWLSRVRAAREADSRLWLLDPFS